ncbi:MAG: alpha/beta fold hydrolase [Chloroflexota bacterium]
MKQKLRGVNRQDWHYDFELYRRAVPMHGVEDTYLNVVDLWPHDASHTVMFVHGYLGCLETWEFQINHFVRNNYRVIAPDLRGHGQSDMPDTYYTMDELSGDLYSIVKSLRIDGPFTLVGHSFGGSICTEYALAYPETLANLVLIATATEYPLPKVADFIFRLPASFFRWWWPWRPRWNAGIRVMKRMMTNNLRQWQGKPLMERIQTPTLVVTGERDLYFPREVFEAVGQTIPNAEVYDVGSAKHKVQLERHESVNRVVERFITGTSQQASWRASTGKERDETLHLERFWLSGYRKETPDIVPISDHPITDFLEKSAISLPKRTAIYFYGNQLTYQELNQRANQLANVLIGQGVQMGDRVMLVLPNTPQLIIAYYGILRAGGVVVLPNPDADAETILWQATQTGVHTLITLSQFRHLADGLRQRGLVNRAIFAEMGKAVGPETYAILLARWGISADDQAEINTSVAAEESMDALMASAPSSKPQLYSGGIGNGRTINPEQLAVIIFTSGTTDAPKGVCLSHRNLVANVLQTRHWTPQLEHGEETFLSVIPLIHSYGMTNGMNIPIALAATIVLMPVFELTEVLAQIQRLKPTAVPGVPSMFTAINQTRNIRDYGLSSVKACISGAAPLPIEVKETFEKLTKGRLVEGYGLTEASPVTHANPLSDVSKPGSIGLPIPNTEARIVDLVTQQPLGPGEVGELQVRGPQVMLGYWSYDGLYDRSCISDDGWLSTGDVAVHDREGYFQLISRKRDTIMAGEFSVYPRDVEEVLYENNKVLEVAVVGIPTDLDVVDSASAVEGGNAFGAAKHSVSSTRDEEAKDESTKQRIKAFVVPRPGTNLTTEELLELCRKRLDSYAVPWEIEFRQELPKSFVGKVLRRMLVSKE